MRNNQLISAIIPVYNGEKYLEEAIQSVSLQNYRPVEIIVVDDGSTDGSSAIAKKIKEVQYHFQPFSGLPTALNAGIKLARGDFFAFLDADDIWMRNKLSAQMTTLRKDPDLDMVLGHVQEFLSPELSGDQANKLHVKPGKNPGYFKGALLIRKASFFRVGLFDTRWVVGDFIDWYKRALEKNLKSLMLPEAVFMRRVHLDNMMLRERDAQKDYARILKEALDRQRLKSADYLDPNQSLEYQGEVS